MSEAALIDPEAKTRERWGTVHNLTTETVIAGMQKLFKNPRYLAELPHEIQSLPPHTEPVLTPTGEKSGTYNRLFFFREEVSGAKFIIRVPAAGRTETWTAEDVSDFESQFKMMDYLRRVTRLALPKYYCCIANCDNDFLPHPFLIMGTLPGITVSSIWHGCEDRPGEASNMLRRSTLKAIARGIAPMSSLSFKKGGSFYFEANQTQPSPTIGPCYFSFIETINQQDGAKCRRRITKYLKDTNSTLDYFTSRLQDIREEIALLNMHPDYVQICNGHFCLLELMIECLPDEDSESPFVVPPPDFNWQNVMYDVGKRTITGFIDWDHAQTKPHVIGWASFPKFLCADIWKGDDGKFHAYRGLPLDDSPKYREMYTQFLKEATNDHPHTLWTPVSHYWLLIDSMLHGCSRPKWALQTLMKLVAPELASNTAFDALMIRLGQDGNVWEEGERADLKMKLSKLLIPQTT
jgi:hypothetical protein